MPATGKVTQVIGSTFDAEFPDDSLPAIYNALHIDLKYGDFAGKLTGEVQQHLGDRWVRTISMAGTEGIKRGYDVTDTGAPISMPVGAARSSQCTKKWLSCSPASRCRFSPVDANSGVTSM